MWINAFDRSPPVTENGDVLLKASHLSILERKTVCPFPQSIAKDVQRPSTALSSTGQPRWWRTRLRLNEASADLSSVRRSRQNSTVTTPVPQMARITRRPRSKVGGHTVLDACQPTRSHRRRDRLKSFADFGNGNGNERWRRTSGNAGDVTVLDAERVLAVTGSTFLMARTPGSNGPTVTLAVMFTYAKAGAPVLRAGTCLAPDVVNRSVVFVDAGNGSHLLPIWRTTLRIWLTALPITCCTREQRSIVISISVWV